MDELTLWCEKPSISAFPYQAVVTAYRAVGKHFVAPPLLGQLQQIRTMLPRVAGAWTPSGRWLASFLDVVLDKHDGRYDYVSYLALDLLPLAWEGQGTRRAESVLTAARCRDRIVLLLMCDVLGFERAAWEHRTDVLPVMRPDDRTVEKRYRLALRVASPLIDAQPGASRPNGTPAENAARLCAMAGSSMTDEERRILDASLFPVHVVHDEHMFIRVLQSFEATFAALVVYLRAAIDAVNVGDCEQAGCLLNEAAGILRGAAPLFSLLATMQVEAFRTFRQFTEGASAIQSRNYKHLESLCRRPAPARLDSIAYQSVPEVQQAVHSGIPDLQSAVAVAVDSGLIGADGRAALEAAMRNFATALARWRSTHYSLAVRMLGERTGTGYTEGTPYLKGVLGIPVFTPSPQRSTV